MRGRYAAGGRLPGTWPRYERTARKATSNAIAGSARPCSTGRTTAVRCRFPRGLAKHVNRGGLMLANRSIPRCTVIPELAYPDVAEAIDWLRDAFGFTLRLRIANHRAQLNVGDCAVVLTERRGDAEGVARPLRHGPSRRCSAAPRSCRSRRRPNPAASSRLPLRRAPIHGPGPRRPCLDVFPVDRRCRSRGMGRYRWLPGLAVPAIGRPQSLGSD